MSISVINPLNGSEWDSLLKTSAVTTFFHSSAWARVLKESYGYTPFYLASIEDGKIHGLIPVMEINSVLTGKRGVSLPFSDECPPIARDQESFKLLWNKLVELGRSCGWKYIELRGGGDFLSDEPSVATHFVHTLGLSSDEARVSRTFKAATRRNIRKAESAGVRVTLDRSLEAVTAFYKLNCGTRRHHGLPPQPWSFFQKIYEHVIAPAKGFVVLAEYQHRWIAGAVYALHRGHAIYKYGASERSSQNLRPNNLVMWEAIRWCCRNGIHTLSFGRTEPDHAGLLQFKRGWGSVEKMLTYYRYNLRVNRFVAGAFQFNKLNRFFQQMPMPLLKMAGNLLYRHMG
jgi:hypothetical protein